MRDSFVGLFLCGDVMTGRGIDQILLNLGDPRLCEAHIKDARAYVRLAEQANGPIARTAGFSRPWGDALAVIEAAAPDVRIVNLETSISRSDDVDPEKGVCYRMSPANVGCLTVARPDVCTLANNHVLDFGERGPVETLDTLREVYLAVAGAVLAGEPADRPAIVERRDGGRVLVFAYGAASSGVPASWAATVEGAGVSFLPDLSVPTARMIAGRISRARGPGDIVVVSVHWGTNLGYDVSPDQIAFAHELIDAGVDVVHGHSSHHPRPIEVYRGKLILYGCGDLINDYEGIGGDRHVRGDLRLPYFPAVAAGTGELGTMRIVPMQARQLRLWHASNEDVAWMSRALSRISEPFGARVGIGPDGAIEVRPK